MDPRFIHRDDQEFVTKSGAHVLCFPLRKHPAPKKNCRGICPNCGNEAHQAEIILDDTYGCYHQCPWCGAICVLDARKDRGGSMQGYSQGTMGLSLPDQETALMDGLPDGIPLAESLGD